MASYYSDHFNGVNAVTLATDNSVLDNSKILATGVGHGRVHYKRAEVTGTFVADDTIRMMQFKSGDRLNQLYWTSTSSGGTGHFGLGLYETGRSHNGVMIDANLFTSGVVVTSAINHVDKFMAPGSPDNDLLRGKALWEMADAGDGPLSDYSADPMEDWDLVLYCGTVTAAETTLFLEAFYTSGD